MLSLSQSRLVNAECILVLPVPNPTFVPVVFAQLGAPDFSFPRHCSLALPAWLLPPPERFVRKGHALRENAAQKVIPLPRYLEIVGSVIISQCSLQIFARISDPATLGKKQLS